MSIFLLVLVLILAASNVYVILNLKKERAQKEEAEKQVAESNRKMIEADSKCICRGLNT